jgi:RNA polymerase sigma-70 factor (ECF subfamily)
MATGDTFADFMRRIRAGDEQAAAELVRRYEPLIRREVRLHLEDRRLSRLFDSMDVCQSVLGSFFLRAAAGQYDLEQPEQLVRLLVTMARNKLASAARGQHRQRRDQRRESAGGAEELAGLADPRPGPEESVAGAELLRRFRDALSAEERQLVDLRGEGLAWADVAARLGGTAQARRMQLARAVDRVARELGIEPAGP